MRDRTLLGWLAVPLASSAALSAPSARPALALTADQLVARNLDARGGAAALAAIKSLGLTGKMIFPGDFQLDYRETRSRAAGGDKSRVDATIQGLTVVTAYDGRTGWRVNPFQGRRDAEQMSADEGRSMADSSLVSGMLQSAAADGSTVTALGREDFDGTDAWKVKVVQKDGDQFTYLLDPDTMLEIAMTETRTVRGALQVNHYELGDYEKIGGVYFPMSVESWQGGQSNQRQRVEIASGEANVAAPDSLFAVPSAPSRTPAGK